MPTHLTAFLITTWLLAMLPGAGQALMIRQVLTGGLRAARGTIAGNASGLLIWSVAAAAGLSAVLLASPRAYAAVRIVGGVVLVVLGVSTLRAARSARAGDSEPSAAEPTGRTGFRGGWLTGLGTCLGNPKAGVFAVSVLPQFVTTSGPVLLSSIFLGVVWALVNACWYLLFSWCVNRGRALVSRPDVQRRLGMVTGVVLLLLGVAVAAGA
ncbi:LysE family translocator [Streptomyces coacervatus]|uniref:LysE family translocator n=1 Tax=Streptomyces coacervatus TaxID=647381 RepID=A0ABP7GVC0_9ACTN|nr:LysE family translocator [Streptomyces coacervatus]MDF2272690.1 LysE family translocator [Streptomyces coacervatus]